MSKLLGVEDRVPRGPAVEPHGRRGFQVEVVNDIEQKLIYQRNSGTTTTTES